MGGEKNRQPAYNTEAMKRIAKAKGWSPRKWALEAGLPPETARNILRRPKTAVKLDVALRLATAAGVDISEIVHDPNSTYSVRTIAGSVETAHHPSGQGASGRNPGMHAKFARIIEELMEISPAAAKAALKAVARQLETEEARPPQKRGTS